MQKNSLIGLLFLCAEVFITSTAKGQPAYVDVASQKGIAVNYTSIDNWGSGVSFFDFDEDGWDDITVPLENGFVLFFKNQGGTFVQLPSTIYNQGQTKQALWVDYDNDGDMDLAVSVRGGRHKLYQNDGNFQFTDVSAAVGLNQINSGNYGLAFGDYDHDGRLDLYVCNYEVTGTNATPHLQNQLYHNNGDGTFTNVTFQAGVGDGFQASFQGNWFDYDDDGWLDLYIINDRTPFKNSLYKNLGNGTFSEVGLLTGSALSGQDPMSNSVADFDNDGDFDIYMSNTGSSTSQGRLLVNNGNGTFSEMGAAYGVNIGHWSWGALWVDHNNNGFQDLYVTTATGAMLPQVTNFFYVNQNGTHFTNGNALLSGNNIMRSYALARGDYNNDGFYDMIQLNHAPENLRLWENVGNTNHFVKITLHGTVSNRMAVGSKIKVYAGGKTYTQFTHCGENYVSQNSQHHLFGLGQDNFVDSVVISFPSGVQDRLYGLQAGQHYHIYEGISNAYSLQQIGPAIFCSGNFSQLTVNTTYPVVWSTGYQGDTLQVSESGWYSASVLTPFGLVIATDSIWLEAAPPPQVLAEIAFPSCFGSSDGEVNIIPNGLNEPNQIIWSNGDEGLQAQNLGEGMISFTYSDSIGCTTAGSFYLFEPSPVIAFIETSPETWTQPGQAYVQVMGGTPPYSFLLNQAPAVPPFENLSAGNYSVLISDSMGCEQVFTFSVGFISGTEVTHAHPGENFRLFPNPSLPGQDVTLSGNFKNHRFSLHDLSGRTICRFAASEQNGQLTLSTPEVSAGLYWLRAENPETVSITKWQIGSK